MPQSGTREATHAGSWYEGRADVLSRQLDEFLDKVPTTIEGRELPITKARVIIAPYITLTHTQPALVEVLRVLADQSLFS